MANPLDSVQEKYYNPTFRSDLGLDGTVRSKRPFESYFPNSPKIGTLTEEDRKSLRQKVNGYIQQKQLQVCNS